MAGGGDQPPLLWQYSFSNFNEKARWALDFKRIPHRRRSLMPGGPRAMAFSRGDGTLPVLDLDGERIVDSTRIIEALERRFPERPLYPEDPAERRQALELEDYFDEHAGHDMRRVGFWELRDERAYGGSFLTTDQGRAKRLAVRAAMPLVFPVAWRFMNERYDFTEEAAERSRAALVVALDRIESERHGGEFLVGASFTVADLTAAALLYPLAWPPEYPYEVPEPPPSEFFDSLRDHPAVAWIADTYRRHRGQSPEVT
ncbi:MAG: glutathione S-transferase family protein [Solirubrobacterales bacterium]